MPRRAAVLLACGFAGALMSAPALHAQVPAQQQVQRTPLWWPGFIDARGKAFLELADDAKLCALARDALRRAAAAPGNVVALPLRAEALLPRGARLTFGIIDTDGVASERVLTRIVAIARSTDKGACAHLAEAGAEAPGYVVEEDRSAFGVHPPRPLVFRAPLDGWRSYGAAVAAGGADARFAAAIDVPPVWRARVGPILDATAEVFGQRVAAVLARGHEAEPLALTGAIAIEASGATYNTLNLISRDAAPNADDRRDGKRDDKPLFQAGPSGGIERNRAGSFVAQIAGALDLDGDGVDEIVLRARYYSGGNLKILRFSNGKFTEVRQTAYEGE